MNNYFFFLMKKKIFKSESSVPDVLILVVWWGGQSCKNVYALHFVCNTFCKGKTLLRTKLQFISRPHRRMWQIYQLAPLLAFYLSDHWIAPLQKSLRSTVCAVLRVGE